MKIISKFKDYYDIGSSYGVDDSIVYVRNKEVVASKERISPRDVMDILNIQTDSAWRFGKWGIYARSGYNIIVVGFCGVLYPAVMIRNKKTTAKYSIDLYDFFFDWDDNIEELITYNEYDSRLIERLRVALNTKPVYDDEMFHYYNTPIFIIPESGLKLLNMWGLEPVTPARGSDINQIVKNPCLRDIQFFKKVDPYSAYQEVMGYVSGVLASNQCDTDGISDICRRDSKGFDKWSFKTPPTKTKRDI